MKLPDWALFRWAALAALAAACAGCSGINATGSASPASFFLPGLMKADPPKAPAAPTVEPATESSQEFAQAR